ncbi:MAG: hypothetical protein HC897_11590 [Thermoanaerobaculia bacterium]|nr:hypothetical protein [Thermoanaerobaculia bacterium]
MSDVKKLDAESARLEPQADLDRARKPALLVGISGTLATFLFAFQKLGTEHAADFFRPYLTAWLLWLSAAMGLTALGMLNHVSGGYWGAVMRRVFEAAGRTLPLFLVLGVPLAFGLGTIYPWANAEIAAHDTLIQYKAAYLNVPFFLARGAFYLVLWWAMATLLGRWSHQHDATGDDRALVKMQRLSAGGLVAYVLTGTFASVDWIMSLEPHWFSSLYGLAFVVGHGLAGLACSVPLMIFLSRRKPLEGLIGKKEFHDYGKLMLALVMVWGYFTVSQYLIIWSGNLPEEVPWYLYRNDHGWQAVTIGLVLGHFVLPFALLLSADLKKKPQRLMLVAVWLLLMRWLDLYWQVAPSVSHGEVAFGPLDVLTPLAIGGLWVWVLLGQLKNRSLVPVHEPELKEALAHG